jgi:hypothetical protein
MRHAKSAAELTELRTKDKILVRCPFCREDQAKTEKERHQKAMIHAETGKAWAQSYVGQDLYFGREGVPKDIKAALHWLTLAADQGDNAALSTLSGDLFKKGDRTSKPEALGGHSLGPRLGSGMLRPRLFVDRRSSLVANMSRLMNVIRLLLLRARARRNRFWEFRFSSVSQPWSSRRRPLKHTIGSKGRSCNCQTMLQNFCHWRRAR